MQIDISDRQDDVAIDKKRIKKISERVLVAEGRKDRVELSIAFVDKGVIRELNGKYRGIDRDTDVLSFPMEEEDMLGDVVICPEVAVRNAEKAGRPADKEIELLVVHGMLHILGYDHEDRQKKDEMWARQAELLADEK